MYGGRVESGDVGALGGDLELAIAEEGIVQETRVLDRGLIGEFHVGESFGVACPFVNLKRNFSISSEEKLSFWSKF